MTELFGSNMRLEGRGRRAGQQGFIDLRNERFSLDLAGRTERAAEQELLHHEREQQHPEQEVGDDPESQSHKRPRLVVEDHVIAQPPSQSPGEDNVIEENMTLREQLVQEDPAWDHIFRSMFH